MNFTPSPLRAGAASVEITPQKGIQIDGDIGRPRPVEMIHDPLYAKALVLEAGGKKVCILSLDLLGITHQYADEIRHRAAKEFGFDFDAVMVHTTQDHSAPGIGKFVVADGDWRKYFPDPAHEWLAMGDLRYIPWAIDRILEAVGKANADLQPAKIGAASGLDPRVAFNRRFIMRDGRTVTNPNRAAMQDILYVEGPSDPEVGVVSIVTPAGTLALLLHHTCHPTHGYPTRTISADWPGTWSDGMKAIVGPRCVPLVLNGCCGNTIHANWADPNWTSDQDLMGRRLTETAGACLPRIKHEGAVVFDYKTKRIQIPIRALPAEDLAAAQKLLKENPTPIWRKDDPSCCEWSWIYAIGRVYLEERRAENPNFEYEIQAFRIGDIALLALIGEPFVEAQLNIKMRSPVRHTYVAHMSNGYVGYIPTKQAFKGGGYETWTCAWSKLVPEALEMICDASVELLEEVFPRGSVAERVVFQKNAP